MRRIKVLNEDVVRHIAAGEVVEHPASVVKELVENALDAEASRIVVEVAHRGSWTIRVSDNGWGMSEEDAPWALERHATSKIASLEDLRRVRTLGFRGEALPSIAAVSTLELVTRTPRAPHGTRVLVRGGRRQAVEPVGCAPGTTVTVTDLFFNVPVRAKHLSGDKAEVARITAVVTALALANPQVAFRLSHEGRRLLETPGNGELLDAVISLYGRDTAEQLLPVEECDEPFRVRGLIGRMALARSDRSHQYFFVNNRPVRSRTLRTGLEQAYATSLPRGKYPWAVLFVECTPELVDVNVHPAKQRVRFTAEARVRELVRRAVERALTGARTGWEIPKSAVETPGVAEKPVPYLPAPSVSAKGEGAHIADLEPLWDIAGESDVLSRLRPLGQLARRYIVCEGPDGLYLVDQHAAHERIHFEQLQGDPAVQELLMPVVVEPGPEQLALWESHRVALERAGFRAEQFGPTALALRSVPSALGNAEPRDAFLQLLSRLREAGPARTGAGEWELVQRALAACVAAVKSSQPLSMEEMRRLISSLAATPRPWTCPHGRPTVLKLPQQRIDRYFHRS